MEETERKGKTPYVFLGILAAITTIFFGMYIGVFTFGKPVKWISSMVQKSQEPTTKEPKRYAVLTYRIQSENYTEEELHQTMDRLKYRAQFWDEKAEVKQLSDNTIELRMDRNYAGEANIETLTRVEDVYVCMKCEQVPKKEEQMSAQFFRSGKNYYQRVLEWNEISDFRIESVTDAISEEVTGIFVLTLSKEKRQNLKKRLSGQKKEKLYLMYNKELLGTIGWGELENDPIRVLSTASFDHANVICRRMIIGNLPLSLKLISNQQ